MGQLVDGIWVNRGRGVKTADGRFVRRDAQFRNWITPSGAPGPSGSGGFAAEPGRYHLYASYACPWAHRTLIFHRLKGLRELVSLSIVHWHNGADGWTFAGGDGVVADPEFNASALHQIYSAARGDYSGRVTVPVLWDRRRKTIVSNESSEIIRMFNSAFDGFGAAAGDYYPEALRGEIDTVNRRIYDTLNDGVYKTGFASTQAAYEEAVVPLFATLDWLEERLTNRRTLVGERITEADWRLFTTLIRFDAVYHGHFKCNLRRILDYPNLSAYLERLYRTPGIAETVRMDHIQRHYYESHTSLNPSGIVPVGPAAPAFLRATAPNAGVRSLHRAA